MSSRRKVQMSMMWKEANVRRSPRISGLNACEGQQQMGRVKVDNNTKKSTAASANASTVAVAGAVGRVKGPASSIRARKKRKLKPLQDVAAAATTTCVSPIAQESEDLDTNSVEDGEEQNLEHLASNSDTPLPVHDDSHQGQPSSLPSALRMPEKCVLELILDVLQRKDTHEIFAEPVDPEEVEEYYEIIKEPMDFGTMRAKLHEGMYTSLEQFEHDVFLISGNAMHFNSSGTIYFRQARIINELSKRVFHSLKTEPDNFKSEFSETRRRTARRPQIEAKGSISSSSAKPATNFRSNSMTANVSSKTIPYSLSGTTILRRSTQRKPESSSVASTLTARENEMLSGATGYRRTSFPEADRRSTYIPWSSFVNDNESNVSSIYNPSKTLKHVNQQEMGYRESLMLFVRDLGPTAQMVARRKLRGWSTEAPKFRTSSSNCWLQAPQCHNPPAYASAPQLQTALDNNVGSVMSQTLSHHCHGHHSIPGNSNSSWIDLCDSDKVGDRMGICAASVEVEPKAEKKAPLAFKEDICTSSAIKDGGISGSDKVHKSRNNVIMSGSNSSTAAARDLNFSVAGLKDKGSLSETMLSEQSMWDNQAESLKLSSDYSQSASWRLLTTNISTSPQTKGTMSNPGSQYLRFDDQAITAQCQSHSVSGSSGASQALKSIQHPPLASQFRFDLPYLKTRLGQINTSTRDESLQRTGRTFLDKMSYQKIDNHQQSSLDSKHTDLVLQL